MHFVFESGIYGVLDRGTEARLQDSRHDSCISGGGTINLVTNQAHSRTDLSVLWHVSVLLLSRETQEKKNFTT